jgi:hypothetical protein
MQMAREHLLPPSAASLSASMRDLGYSLETAVADLVDNCISAEARTIEIFCDLSQSTPTLAVVDNGHGMNADEILVAMRHGAANPKQERSSRDLGRFGLGLKTASFSQCRRLTVASMKDGISCAAEWDLDLIDSKDDWIVSILDDGEIAALPFIDRLKNTGTIVIWRALDRLFEDEVGQKRDEIVNEKLTIVGKHLALVFHRFLAGEFKGRKVKISVNGHSIEPFDPFCRKNSATQMLEEEVVRIGEESVRMQTYILPHHSRLSAVEYDFYQDRSDFISNQGAYIYRGGRLMAWGDWFRLIPKGEATKLARVQIDFPNSLDKSWTIDIKKSRARPPHAVRERLRQIISKISARSTAVHRGRGRKLFDEVTAPLWERYADNGKICFSINKEHPLVGMIREKLDTNGQNDLNLLMETISASLPVEMIYSDFSTNPREIRQSNLAEEDIFERLRALKIALFDNDKGDARSFRQIMESTRMFIDHIEIADKFIGDEFDE